MRTENGIDLKPCPLRGGEAEFSSGYCNDLNYARVDCTNCSAGVYNDSDRDQDATMDELEKSVLEDWNRRATNAN